MATKKMDIQKYWDAIKKIKDASDRGLPIKKAEFIQENELTPTFFKVMVDLKVVKELVTSHRDGTMFTWIYKKADNETDSKIASRVTDTIFEINQAAYKKYSSPEWQEKARRRKLERLKKESSKSKPVTIFKGLHEEKVTVATIAPKEEKPVVVKAPVEVVIVETEIADLLGEVVFEPIRETPTEFPTKISKTEFSISGEYSKEEMMRKIMALVDEGQIASFSISVEYNSK